MAKNILIQVVNDNGVTKTLSNSIIIELLKNYTKEWGKLSSETKMDSAKPSTDDNIKLFNKKIGYTIPKMSLSKMIEDVIQDIEDENPDFVLQYHSFNDLEKIGIYFILRVNKSRSVTDLFDALLNNYEDLSKRDIIIKFLSESLIEEKEHDLVNPVFTLFDILQQTNTHEPVNISKRANHNFSGKLDFIEFSVPMHSYNVSKRFTPLSHMNKMGFKGDIVPYYETFNNSFKKNGEASKISEVRNSLRDRGGMRGDKILVDQIYKARWKDATDNVTAYKLLRATLDNPLTGFLSLLGQLGYGTNDQRKMAIESLDALIESESSYRTLLNISHLKNELHTSDKKLVRYIGENFLDTSGLNSTTDNPNKSYGPLTYITDRDSDLNQTASFGEVTKKSHPNKFKSLMAYYGSDLNLRFTNGTNNIMDLTNKTGILPNGGQAETKGYFNNITFIESSIQRILYPMAYRMSKGLYDTNKYMTNGQLDYNKIFRFDNETEVYDQIFDSIINNSNIYTNKSNNETIRDNYELIPIRTKLESGSKSILSKPNNLFEFINNTLFNSLTDTYEGVRYYNKSEDYSDINKYPSTNYILTTPDKYNVLEDNLKLENNLEANQGKIIIKNPNNPTTQRYMFDDLYIPEHNTINELIKEYTQTEDNKNYSIVYKDKQMFVVPIKSNTLNRDITTENREILIDSSNLLNYEIKGQSTSDFTYGEKALLEEYISGFASTLRYVASSKQEVIELMIDKLEGKVVSVKEEYFPAWLSTSEKDAIIKLLKRSIIEIPNKKQSNNGFHINQVSELMKNGAIRPNYKEGKVNPGSDPDQFKISIHTLGKEFNKNMKIIANEIMKTPTFINQIQVFTSSYQSGSWQNIYNGLLSLKDVMIDDNLIEAVITNPKFNMYENTKQNDKGLLKKLDIAIYKLIIRNFFDYIADNEVEFIDSNNELNKRIMKDNDNNGIVRYYSDLMEVGKFLDCYYTLLPKYVSYLESSKLPIYYSRLLAIKKLPTWDYEAMHIRDKEESLKKTAGVNKWEYNLVWPDKSNGVSIIYKTPGTSNRHSHTISSSIYNGGITAGDNPTPAQVTNRIKWWDKYIHSSNHAHGQVSTPTELFKIPSIEFFDTNVVTANGTWTMTNPDQATKKTLFEQARISNKSYMDEGYITTLSNFIYKSQTGKTWRSIGSPLLVFDDRAYKENNQSNTVRTRSFSFEHNLLNMWYTDEIEPNGTWNNRSLTDKTNKLVSQSELLKHFGFGKLDLQKLIRHYWNFESTPMTSTYTIMNHQNFSEWNEGFDATKGHYPWSTSTSKNSSWVLFFLVGYFAKLFAKDVPADNKYMMSYVLDPFYNTSSGDESWVPVRLSGNSAAEYKPFVWLTRRSVTGVSPYIRNHQIMRNIHWRASSILSSQVNVRLAIEDVFNRNLKNRIYMSLMDWRYLSKNIMTTGYVLDDEFKEAEQYIPRPAAGGGGGIRNVDSVLKELVAY